MATYDDGPELAGGTCPADEEKRQRLAAMFEEDHFGHLAALPRVS